ncbi:S8 family serine peptidase [Bacteriovorax sp. Seq25_V]|uniref:S8 family serine peptidase n=1 Tax=Bacteriovorax sp. Seq25_V TaxID=1201288 RepID=UPI00038A539A|nr:S8 family serine peptidase [Bacteriovorax sp. Seq25_V]EQC44361.1 peptidase, S8/S53 family [Bacteriovorax sp. Seq25_V]
MKKISLKVLLVLLSINYSYAREVINYFSDGKSISKKRVYDGDRLLAEHNYSIDGEEVTRTLYEYREDGSFYRINYMNNFERPKRKELVALRQGEEVVIERYGFDKTTFELENIDTLDGDRVVSRYVFAQEGENFTYRFNYDEDRIIGFDVLDTSGDVIGDYDQSIIGDIPGGPQDAVVKIAVIDSGFDHGHADLRDHILINPNENFDGVDNDGDGFVDNVLGVHYDAGNNLKFSTPLQGRIMDPGPRSSQKAGVYGIPFETINTNATGQINSHGTHVASIALRDLESASLLAFAGDFGEAKYLDLISKKLKESKVDFVNMSFSFPHFSSGDVARETYRSLQEMFKNNPETIFFVAAGNNGRHFTASRDSCLYPACYQFDNVVTIGATDSDKFDETGSEKMAEYSNFSETYVDFFAPGTKVKAALLGDMQIRYSGTSMASPMALNQAAKLKEAFPELTAKEVIELMKKRATKTTGIISKYGLIRPY